MFVGLIILGIVLQIACPCRSFDFLQYLGQSYRENLIRFREDAQFGDKSILDEYDFIVVGAGASGATVARRLAEVSEWNILLLEAGGEESMITSFPAIAHYLHFTDYNWGFRTEKELRACKGLINQRCLWPAGKGLGGSTIINGNMYTRGFANDFDRWEEAGNPGWSYDDVLPYFMKNEDVNIPELKRSPYRGVGGPLPVSYPPIKSQLLNAFLEAGREIGIPVGDYNAPNASVVFSRLQSTTLNGMRVTAAKAYLQENVNNLHVVEYGYVTKLLINDSTNAAYGVEFVKNNRRRKVLAKKEVIVSAGAFNSAKLLMLSGIGPKDHLETLGITCVSDLRVGDNLQEHPAFAGLHFGINETLGFVADRLIRNGVGEMLNMFKRGSWISTLPMEGVGYVKSKYSGAVGDLPDIEYIFMPATVASDAGLGGTMIRRSMGVPDNLYYGTYNGALNKDAWTIVPMLMYPKSRGQVRGARSK